MKQKTKIKRRSAELSKRLLSSLAIGVGLIACGVASMALLTGSQEVSQARERALVVPARVDYPAPELTLADLEGVSRSLKDYRGQVVLVNLWASWCPPCVAELPTLNAFYGDYADQGFVLIGINAGESPSHVREYVLQRQLNFPIWIDTEQRAGEAFRTMSLPSSFVIDRQGRVRLEWLGAIERTMLDKYVVPLLREQ